MDIGFNVRSYPESGHSEGIREMSAFDPKRTFYGRRRPAIERHDRMVKFAAEIYTGYVLHGNIQAGIPP